MPGFLKETLESVKKQIADHRKAEGKRDAKIAEKSIQDRLHAILDRRNPANATFPWLCASFVHELVGTDEDLDEESGDPEEESMIPTGILNVGFLYKIMEELSSGTFFTTYLGVMRRNDLWCSIRTYGFGQAKHVSVLAHKEAQVSALVSGNKFFAKLITCFKTLSGFYIIKEHVKCIPLHNFIKQQERFNDEELRFYAQELVCAIDFLHSKKIVHRDVSAANISLIADGHIKVTNLQNSHLFTGDEDSHKKSPEVGGMVGTLAYMSPEMINHKLYSYTVDWWGLGVVLYFMMNGTLPFQGSTRRELHRHIMYTEPMYQEGLHSSLTHDLIKAFLAKQPSKRLGHGGSRQIFSHPYFEKTVWIKVLGGQTEPPFLPETSAVTCLPSALCTSLDNLNLNDAQTRFQTRRDLERLQAQSLAPDQFMEFELEQDWTTYLQPNVHIEMAYHYVHALLKPPKEELEGLALEECITSVPELSAEEKEVFRRYLKGTVLQPTTLIVKKLGTGEFKMIDGNSPENALVSEF